jgi:hypothetical protein
MTSKHHLLLARALTVIAALLLVLAHSGRQNSDVLYAFSLVLFVASFTSYISRNRKKFEP